MCTKLFTERALAARYLRGMVLILTALLLATQPIFADDSQPPGLLNEIPKDNLSGHVLGQSIPDAAAPLPLGTSQGRWELLRPSIITYEIQPGDNDWSIAQKFGLDIDTLRYSNEWMRRNPDLIYPGNKLVILPVKGAYTTVKAGDTLLSIAQRYGVNPRDIASFPLNDVSGDSLVPGQQLVIPGGRLDYADQILAPGPGKGYALAWPLRGTVTQRFHPGHSAIDVASYYGAKVYASRGGRVVYARFSPDGWLGFRVIIAHDNGLRTAYNHMSGIFVEEGQDVARGEVIGQVGSTGNSTGPHVHYEVFQNGVRVNPLGLLPPSPAD